MCVLVCVCVCVCTLQLRAHLRQMCVVFAGPFPSGFGEREVKRLFRCCGAVKCIRMLPTSHRVNHRWSQGPPSLCPVTGRSDRDC